MKVAICIGHSRKVLGRTEGGAISIGGVTEHEFNSEVAGFLEEKLAKYGIKTAIFDVYGGSSYGSAMDDIARKVRSFGADIAIELHFNASSSPHSKGYEFLCWHNSNGGKRLATLLLSEFGREFPAMTARGVKLCNDDSRGAGFLKKTHSVAVLAEPFFGSNEAEWKVFSQSHERVAEAYANAIAKYFGL
jgi:N-acetylmuramoyl-L-alanine amidase